MKSTAGITRFLAKNNERNSHPRYAIHSLELALTFLLFVLFGRYLDSRFSTSPIWILALSAFGFVAVGLTGYYRFKLASEALDIDQVWSKKATRVSIQDETNPDPLANEELVVPKGYGNEQ